MNVAIIPARGGSKRIPRKNIRLFHGKPIIAYSIETAKASGLFKKVIVSTDDEEIAFIATRYGAEAQMRPWQLSDDQTGTPEVAAHVLSETQPCKCACVIYATAPLMAPDDLEVGYRTMRERHMQFAFSIGTEPLRDAGQWYWGRSIAFTRVLPIFAPHTAMVPIDNARVCDINVETDWRMAERMYADLNRAAA